MADLKTIIRELRSNTLDPGIALSNHIQALEGFVQKLEKEEKDANLSREPGSAIHNFVTAEVLRRVIGEEEESSR
jgi:hypothetical protein